MKKLGEIKFPRKITTTIDFRSALECAKIDLHEIFAKYFSIVCNDANKIIEELHIRKHYSRRNKFVHNDCDEVAWTSKDKTELCNINENDRYIRYFKYDNIITMFDSEYGCTFKYFNDYFSNLSWQDLDTISYFSMIIPSLLRELSK